MKAIFSHAHNPFSFYPTKNYVELTALANFFAKKQGFKTVFYTDEKSLPSFNKINFDYIKLFPKNIFDNLPKCFWSAGKLISLSLVNEPSIHIDNDLFLTKPISRDFLKNDIFCFHDEAFNIKMSTNLQNLFSIQPQETENYPSISYNCGIIGGQDIKIIQQSINILMNYIKENAEIIDNFYIKYKNSPNFMEPSVLIEQIWLFQIFKFFNINISQLINIKNWKTDFDEKISQSGYIHLMRNKETFVKNIHVYLKRFNIEY